jgi:hemolysin III
VPSWRGLLHTFAFATAIPAGLALVMAADRPAARAGVAIYALSLVAVFGTSAAYHRLARSPTSRRIMRRLDHSMIYVMIAGTYTPVCLVVLPPAWGIPMLAVVWTGAVVGITLKLVSAERLSVPANTLYLVMGWTAVVATPTILSHMPGSAVALMVAGGVAYTVGAVVLFVRRPDPHPTIFGYHEVWHALTVAAGACHFLMIWMVT